jgi:hypothetical protein
MADGFSEGVVRLRAYGNAAQGMSAPKPTAGMKPAPQTARQVYENYIAVRVAEGKANEHQAEVAGTQG